MDYRKQGFGTQTADTGYVPRIVIVDDDEVHLQFIKMVILKEQFTCELQLYSSARQTLGILAENPCDLLLLDVKMPEMDGFEMIDHLKKNPATADIPVIFLTASHETEDLVRAYEAGAADYISKPINSAVLAVRIRSVLQRMALENELKLRNEDLLRANRFKDELLSICSHDLRAPLAAIEVICSSLAGKRQLGGAPGEQPPADRIMNQSRLARRLVDNLLDYNKIEQGMLVPSHTFFSAREFLLECAEAELPLVQANGLTLRTDLPGEDVLVFGDRELLAQAVRNPLGNAIKFAASELSLAGGTAEMTAARGGWLEIRITDDGSGIPAEKQDEIFEKYAKGDPNGMGSGLGLYIAREVLAAHGGTIRVEPGGGRGTTLKLLVPHAFVREQLPDLSPCAQARGLVISPSRATAELLEGILVEGGLVYLVSEVSGAPDADAPARHDADFVVVDLTDPEINFFKLTKMINKAGESAHWIFYGAATEAETLGRLVRVPFSHLPAPVNPLTYLNLVASLTEKLPQIDPKPETARSRK